MNKKKSRMTMLAALGLVAIISVGVTLALSQALTNVEVNNFMVKNPDSFAARLVEDKFTPAEQDKAKKLFGGQVVQKNPHIINESTDGTEGWVGMRIEVLFGGVKATPTQLADINELISLDFKISASGWTRDSGATDGKLKQDEVFFYNSIIKPGAQTTELFTTVTVSDTASEALIRRVHGYGQFDLKISGIALDGEYGTALDNTIKGYIRDGLGYTP